VARATFDAIWDWDVVGNSLEWNDGTKSFFGYEPDAVGADLNWWIENIHPEDRTRVVNSVHAVIESGASVWSSEYQFRCYDGTYAMVFDRGYVVRDETGKAFRMVGAMNDITVRKQAEKALLERTERSELIAAGAYDAIWDWDVPNHRVNFSPRWKELRGFVPDEVSDREEEWTSHIHPNDAPRVMAALLAHFEGKTEFFEEEYRICCKDGSWKWILDRGLAQRNAAGQVVRMAGSESDITERKQAEGALQESNERLRTLHVQLSAAEEAGRKRMARELHDQFGQTLTLLKFELSELSDCVFHNGLVQSGSPASDKLKSITTLVDSTIKGVRNISSFLRPPILDDFGLIPALEWLGEDLQERTHVPCSISIDPQLTHLSLTEAQTTTLFRIAQELLTNVIRHANASHVKLEFKKESNAFILDVCDNGQGIRKENLSGSDSFGLRGIRERAWLLGGHFTIQGQPGKGTTATARIPIDS